MTISHDAPEAAAYRHFPHNTVIRLRGVWLIAARVVWIVFFGLGLVLLIAALPIFFQASHTLSSPETQVPGQVTADDALLMQHWGFSLTFYATYQTALIALFSLVFSAAGALVCWRRSDDRVALFVSLWFVLFGPTGSPLLDPLIRAHPAWLLPVRFMQGASIGSFPILTYIFPDGRFVPRWTRALTVAWMIWIVIAPFTRFAVGDFNGASVLWFGILIPIGMGIGIIAQIYRYRRVSSRIERQQTKWVVFGFCVIVAGFVLYSLFPLLVPSVTEAGLPRVLYLMFSETVFLVIPFCLLPLFMGIAILRYRLWDIDLLINRTLVYSALSAGVIGVYVLLVGSLGALFQSTGNLLITLLATGLAALLAQPLRARVQRGVNRLMYGERDDPYTVLSRLSQQLKTTLAPAAVLPTIAETIAQTLKLPYVAITLTAHDHDVSRVGRQSSLVAAFGTTTENLTTLPLVYQTETVGELLVAPRAPGEAFTPSERRLLEDIALQAGVAAHAVRLTTDLQRSRERLVTTREEERRRLRRDLHDGLGPQLASLTLTLAAARELLRYDTEAADQLLVELSAHTQAAITDIRRVVYELRPPALDDLGLVLAMREHVARVGHVGLHIHVEAPEQLPPLPAAVEVAAYRIMQEALTNVIRHAQAQHCAIHLTCDEALTIDIKDDGIGLPRDRRSGVGLTSMRERTDELGGTYQIESLPGHGTSLQIRLPLHQGKL